VKANNISGVKLTVSVVRLNPREVGVWRESCDRHSQLHKLAQVPSWPSGRGSGGGELVSGYHVASWKKLNCSSM